MFANFAKLTWQIHENLHPQNLSDFTNHEKNSHQIFEWLLFVVVSVIK